MTINEIRGISQLTDDIEDVDEFIHYQTDIPESVPNTPITVVHAGITNQAVYVMVPSMVDVDDMMLIAGKMDLFAGLPSHRRGVHMSRMVEVCHQLNHREWPSLSRYLETMAAAVAEQQELDTSKVVLRAETTVTRKTPVMGRPSPDTFFIEASSSFTRGSYMHLLGLGGSVITACPCTQAFSRYATIAQLISKLGESEANRFGFENPTYTHSQRGLVWLRCEIEGDEVGIANLYTSIDAGAHLTYALLKRPDEHALVREAHERPQFTEDVARDVASDFVRRNERHLRPDAHITVTCRNVESIHGHDAYSEVSATITDISRELLSS